MNKEYTAFWIMILNMTLTKQLAKELKTKSNITICYKTLSGTLKMYDFQWINGFLTVTIGQVEHDSNGTLVLKQVSEVISVNHAESLIFRALNSTEIVNYSVSIY